MSRQKRSKNTRKHKHAENYDPIVVLGENDLYQILDDTENPFILFLEGVQDPRNLGACLRSADAAGVNAVVIPRKGSVAMTEVVIQAACGAAGRIPLIQVLNFGIVIKQLYKRGITTVGTSDKSEQCIYDENLTGPIAIFLGSEGAGVRKLTLENCDLNVFLPMEGHVDCLNVSVAAGICLFEIVRQRRAGGD